MVKFLGAHNGLYKSFESFFLIWLNIELEKPFQVLVLLD